MVDYSNLGGGAPVAAGAMGNGTPRPPSSPPPGPGMQGRELPVTNSSAAVTQTLLGRALKFLEMALAVSGSNSEMGKDIMKAMNSLHKVAHPAPPSPQLMQTMAGSRGNPALLQALQARRPPPLPPQLQQGTPPGPPQIL
jgi:hypothetical protein